ncbi:hypothetical protein [Desertivirga xinjiangensis]|uniref:hypothetical protein n=1 Tax=Desertivirga xinjiangensis TaxID=539206 RepID=UPI002109DD14|nr:hypothetical protein [Pedobacter xinjiangensis]
MQCELPGDDEYIDSLGGVPERTFSNTHIGPEVDSCRICDYLAHKQGRELYLSFPPQLVLPILEPVMRNTPVIAVNYKFTLQGFTNKGPPYLLA